MHLLRGEFIAYNILHALLDTLHMLEQDLPAAQSATADTTADATADTTAVPSAHSSTPGTPTDTPPTPTLTALLRRYQQQLHTLQDFSLPDPTHCGFECRTKPVCYTDFLPNFNPPYALSNMIVNRTTTWNRTEKRTGTTAAYGYQDVKVYYETREPGARLDVRVRVAPLSPYLRVCSQNVQDSMKHAAFYFDFNATTATGAGAGTGTGTGTGASAAGGGSDSGSGSNSGTGSSPPARLVLWTQRKYVGDECTLLTEIPPGNHILTVINNSTYGSPGADTGADTGKLKGKEKDKHHLTLSHVVTYE
jgi:hypothetical protein